MAKSMEVKNHVATNLLLPFSNEPAHLAGADSVALLARHEEWSIIFDALLVLDLPTSKLVELVPEDIGDRDNLPLAVFFCCEALARAFPDSKLNPLPGLPVCVEYVPTVERLDL